MQPVAESQPFVALGVLSSAITYETGRTVAAKCRARRARIRLAVQRFPEVLERSVIMRFVLASNYSQRASGATRAANEVLMADAHKEAELEKDIVFLNITESFHLWWA